MFCGQLEANDEQDLFLLIPQKHVLSLCSQHILLASLKHPNTMSSVCTPGCTHLSAVFGGLVGKHFAHQADAQQEGAGRAADPTSTGSASAPPVTSLCSPTTRSFGPSQLPLPHLYLHHPQCSYPNTVQSCSPAVRRYVFCGRAGS